MKLIDILVRELPERGGWPDGSNACRQFPDGEICFNHVSREPDFYAELSDDVDLVWRATKSPHVTKEQYEAALAASKQEWNGEGLPPVGCECEFNAHDRGWGKCVVLYASEFTVLLRTDRESDPEEAFVPEDIEFRPIRSESDKKREVAIEEINSLVGDIEKYPTWRDAIAAIYDAGYRKVGE